MLHPQLSHSTSPARLLYTLNNSTTNYGGYNMTGVLVTGGTGVLGREVVPELIVAGFTVRIMSRRPRPASLLPDTEWARADLETGQGIFEAVSDIDVIVHAATSV